MGKFNEKWLEGITYRTVEVRKVKDADGKGSNKSFPVERPAKAEDVLDWKDNGDTVGIVLKDGQKYSVGKNGKGNGNSGIYNGGSGDGNTGNPEK